MCIPQAMAQKQGRMEKLLRYLNDNDTAKWQKNREKLDNNLRVHKQEDSKYHQNTTRKQIKNRGIQFFRHINQDMIQTYQNQQNSKYKLTYYIHSTDRHKYQTCTKGYVYD